MTVQAQIDEYLKTRLAYDDAHAVSSDRYKQYQGAKAKLSEAMVEAQQQGVKFRDGELAGMNFFLKNQFGISCNAENEEQIKEWLHDRYGDVHEFTTQKVVKKTVEDRLKSDIEGEQLDEFEVPDFMKLKTRPDVSCTGYKKYAAERKN